MSKLIEKELEASNKWMMLPIGETRLVELSRDNVAKVEAILRNDSSYIKGGDKEAGPNGKQYSGSTAYWMMRLKDVLLGGREVPREQYAEILGEVIRAVDRDNSTHLNADMVGPKEILDRLLGVGDRLVEYLRHPAESRYCLVEMLSERTHPSGFDKKGVPYKARENLSFASKFCHYACYYLFEGLEEQDNYSIYDNVVRRVLPFYARHFGVAEDVSEKTLEKNYVLYQETINKILRESGNKISRHGFDHLLWYYYKGRIGDVNALTKCRVGADMITKQ